MCVAGFNFTGPLIKVLSLRSGTTLKKPRYLRGGAQRSDAASESPERGFDVRGVNVPQLGAFVWKGRRRA